MPIDALLFDKDGTLFDFAATWEAFARAFLLRITQNDLDRATVVGRTIGFGMIENRFSPDSIVIAGTPSEIADALMPSLPEMEHAAIVDLINEEAARAPQAEAVPLIPFLDGLRQRGIKLGVATNDAESPALAHLGAAGIEDRFDFIAGFDSGHGAKPGPGQLLAFAAHVGVDPSRVAMVGDSTHDLKAGRAAGMVTIGVLTGLAGPEDLSPLADVVLPDIGHIPGWLAA
ncbi:HAD family hydrolase [Ruegeria sp. HKCCD8929]|uniref:HAD family hydrolase n=1 Tax=Ruegeria sp. HKCCD8929 TaxID=2683006 RepID=UPI0014899343|nr:HAD family hydrolase [Ruegeria sp. HKCCD8929]